ncbi:MAG: hypothetical protein JJU45_08075 [Acidimicrobiia bacterium]|nr:hypothetical protein [Acidimicrobiia bacterium]
MTSTASPDELLRTAFPLGSVVEWASGGSIATTCDIVDDQSDDHSVPVRFGWAGGHVTGVTTHASLETGADTGRLDFADDLHVRRLAAEDLLRAPSLFADLVGPQAASDAAWTRRMRLHQSWWRTFRLRVPYGTGPHPTSTSSYGNMLTAADADAGRNFLTDDARSAYSDRVATGARGIDSFRTSRNLLASQPMAFNVFGHLSRRREVAADLFRTVLDDPTIETVTRLEIERLSDALGDHTAFDAFATFVRTDGSTGCVAIETKLTEPFSTEDYDWDKYLQHAAFDPADWTTKDPAVLGDRRWSQLWRNHLLARAEAKALTLGTTTVLVVHHPNDPHCATVVDDYRGLLRDPSAVRAADLQVVHDALVDAVTHDEAQAAWLDALRERYLDLALSEPLVEVAALHR